MAFLSVAELFDIVVMSLVVGFIFKDAFRAPTRSPEAWMRNVTPRRLFTRDYWYAVALVAPAIIFHELGHKVAALAYGLDATFRAAYGWLAAGVVLKLLMPGFLFFVPAYVAISGSASSLEYSLIAFMGPAVNLVFWLGSRGILKSGWRLTRDQGRYLALFARINMFLFIFNMIPLPFFDGSKVFSGLLGW